MKATHFTRVTAAILLGALLATSAFARNRNRNSDKEDAFDLDQTYSIEKGKAILLHSDDADVTITGSNRKDVHVVIHYRREVSGLSFKSNITPFDMEIYESNGNLMIREISGSVSISGFMFSLNEDYSIQIEAPHWVALKLRGEDDDYRINNIKGDISLRMDDGNAFIKNAEGANFDFDFEDGEVHLVGGKGILDASFDDGDFSCDECEFDNVTIQFEDGDCDVETAVANKGRYKIRCDDGAISFDILKGGGKATLEYDDGRARVSGNYEAIDEDDGFKEVKIPGGSAIIQLRTMDGAIRLRN